MAPTNSPVANIIKFITYEPKKKENLPEKVFFNKNKKTTTLVSGDKIIIVKCGDKEKFSKRQGFLEAYFQLMSGTSKNKCLKYLDEIENDSKYEIISKKDKRKTKNNES